MSEYETGDMGERTEEATPRKIEEAREKGRVAHSPDLSTAIILLGGLFVLKFWGHCPLDAMHQFTCAALGNLDVRSAGAAEVYACFGQAGVLMLQAMMPVVSGLLLVAFLANVVQTGFLFSADPVTLKFERLNPVEGMKKLVSRRGMVRLIAGIFKVVVVGLVAFFTIRGQINSCVGLADASVAAIFAFMLQSTFDLGLRIGMALLALAIADFAYQKWQYRQDLKMTKQEVRDELKRMEGDPLTRDRRRRMQRQVATQRMMHRVPSADVVVTDGMETAVALRYESDRAAAPVVVAKGKGHIAERIRETAEESEVPVVDRADLARSLAQACDAGAQVPADLYPAVAEVMAFAHELSRMKAMRVVRVA